MVSKYLSWKNSAKVIGFILTASAVVFALKYYQHRHFSNPMIPFGVLIQAAKPYLTATIVSIIATITAWFFYYISKYKITALIGVIAFVSIIYILSRIY